MRKLQQAFLLCLVLFLSTTATAASDNWDLGPQSAHEVQQLNWKNPEEALLYRTCGCADSCWTARLYKRSQIKNNRTSGEPITTLRCDCEKLWAKSTQQKKESIYESSCDRFNESSDKLPLISKEISTLLTTKKTKPQL
jgi:hypothetical protein